MTSSFGTPSRSTVNLNPSCSVEVPNYNEETMAAIEEARNLSRDSNAKSYKTMEELKEALKE